MLHNRLEAPALELGKAPSSFHNVPQQDACFTWEPCVVAAISIALYCIVLHCSSTCGLYKYYSMNAGR